MSRLPRFQPELLDDAQREIYDTIIGGPRGKFGGPFLGLIHAPAIADQVQSLGAALRFKTALSADLRELVILVAARHWRSQVEWNAHVVIGLREGLTEPIIGDILRHRLPQDGSSEQQTVFLFCRESLEDKVVCEATYQRTVEAIGVEQVVEVVSLLGYFALLALLLNAFEIAADPIDGVPPTSLMLDTP
jgi:4-carboxymuconolactone decarboxylase